MDPYLKILYITLLNPATELPSTVKVTLGDIKTDKPYIYEFLCKNNITKYRYGLTVSIDLHGDNGWHDTRNIPLTTPIKGANE